MSIFESVILSNFYTVNMTVSYIGILSNTRKSKTRKTKYTFVSGYYNIMHMIRRFARNMVVVIHKIIIHLRYDRHNKIQNN